MSPLPTRSRCGHQHQRGRTAGFVDRATTSARQALVRADVGVAFATEEAHRLDGVGQQM